MASGFVMDIKWQILFVVRWIQWPVSWGPTSIAKFIWTPGNENRMFEAILWAYDIYIGDQILLLLHIWCYKYIICWYAGITYACQKMMLNCANAGNE